MELLEIVDKYIKENADNELDAVITIKEALEKVDRGNLDVLFDTNGELIVLDREKDVSIGVVVQDDTVVEFANTEDAAVSIGSMARYNVLNHISDEQDRESIKELFTGKKTWIIHCETDGDDFNAHTHGLNIYGHPEFRIAKKLNNVEIAYILNSLGYSVTDGHALKNGDIIKNLYEDYDVLVSEADDGCFNLTLIAETVEGE